SGHPGHRVHNQLSDLLGIRGGGGRAEDRGKRDRHPLPPDHWRPVHRRGPGIPSELGSASWIGSLRTQEKPDVRGDAGPFPWSVGALAGWRRHQSTQAIRSFKDVAKRTGQAYSGLVPSAWSRRRASVSVISGPPV